MKKDGCAIPYVSEVIRPCGLRKYGEGQPFALGGEKSGCLEVAEEGGGGGGVVGNGR